MRGNEDVAPQAAQPPERHLPFGTLGTHCLCGGVFREKQGYAHCSGCSVDVQLRSTAGATPPNPFVLPPENVK